MAHHETESEINKPPDCGEKNFFLSWPDQLEQPAACSNWLFKNGKYVWNISASKMLLQIFPCLKKYQLIFSMNDNKRASTKDSNLFKI